jgi:hypothetical protein
MVRANHKIRVSASASRLAEIRLASRPGGAASMYWRTATSALAYPGAKAVDPPGTETYGGDGTQ